jgi:transcription factor C subunit 6
VTYDLLRDLCSSVSRDALKYLPTDTVTTEGGELRSPPQVNCYIGPHDGQTPVAFNMFDSVATCTCCMLHPFVENHTKTPEAEYFEDGTGYVFCAGSPVWGMDWCPTHQADRPSKNLISHHFMVQAKGSQLGGSDII